MVLVLASRLPGVLQFECPVGTDPILYVGFPAVLLVIPDLLSYAHLGCIGVCQVMEHEDSHRHAGTCWMCWYCASVFMAQKARMHHMSRRHARRKRLAPPGGCVALHLLTKAARRVEPEVAATATPPTVRAEGGVGPDMAPPTTRAAGGVGPAAAPSTTPASIVVLFATPTPICLCEPGGASESVNPAVGGLGVVRVPMDNYARVTLAVPRHLNVFQTSTAACIGAYYEAQPKACLTKRLVPPSVGQRLSRLSTRLLQEKLKFVFCVGGPSLSKSYQMWYASVLLMAERGGRGQGRGRGCHWGRGARNRRLPGADDTVVEAVTSSCGEDPRVVEAPGGESSDGSDDMHRELGRARTSKRSFAAAVREEQRRVLSRLRWEETPNMVEAVRYLFYSSNLLLAALDLSQNAGLVQLWGEELGVGADGSRLRADMLDTYNFLTEERPVRRVHGSLSFVFAVQLFTDETVVSWSAAHYVYPIRARV